MTDEEFASWGATEWALRKDEMENASSEAEFKTMQAACAARRKAVGLSAGQAAKAVIVAQRIARGDSLSFAMR